MKQRTPSTALRVLLVALALVPFLLWTLRSSAVSTSAPPKTSVTTIAGSDPVNLKSSMFSPLFGTLAPMPFGTQPAANLDQVRNGSAASPTNPVNWVNGNAGSQTAHYREGQSILYRMTLTNMPTTGTNTVSIEWDIRHSSTEAIDYITSVIRTPPGGISETVHVCGDAAYNTLIPGCTEGTFNTIDIPAPPVSKTAASGKVQPTTSFNALPAVDKKFRIYNGTISSLQYINNADGNLGQLNVAQSSTRMKISFTATSSTVVLSWGGHIASRGDWGFINGVPDSAGGVSGSPYHTRLIELCPAGMACGGGNQDRSLSAAAVTPPLECGITGPETVCPNATAHYEVSAATVDASSTYTWALSSNTSGATITNHNDNPGAGTVFADVSSTGAGQYTVTATPSNAGGSGSACPFITTVNAPTAITAQPSSVAVCPGSPASFSVTATGTGLTYQWKKEGVAISGATSNTFTIPSVSPSDGGNYTVTVTGTCGAVTSNAALLTVKTPAALTNIAPVTACEGAFAEFSTTASGTGASAITWKDPSNLTIVSGSKYVITNVGLTSTLRINNLTTNDAGSYTASTTGDCNSASKPAVLTVTPNVGITTGPSDASACQGAVGPVVFNVTATGANLHYAWKVNNVAAGTDSSTLSFNPSALAASTTPYPVTVHVTSDNGCSPADANATLTINANPTVTIGISNACATGATLTATIHGGSGTASTYAWSGPGIVGATNGQSITVNATGVYTVTVTDTKTCSGSIDGQLCFTLTSPAPPIAAIQTRPSTSSYMALAKPEPSFLTAMVRIAMVVPLILF